MKIKDLNNTIINAIIQTGTVIDCKEGYMEISQQSLSEPTLTISVPSTVTVGTPTTITVTASASGSIVLYINQEYIGMSEGSATYQYVYTPQDTFTIEAYFTSQYGTVANIAKEIIPSTTPTTYAVQSTDSQGENYNPAIQQWAYSNGYAANEGYTTMEEAALVTSLEGNAFANSSIDHIDELTNFNITSVGNGAFTNCDSLVTASLPSGITKMGTGVFSGCARLTSVTIPDSVTSMGNETFAECEYLNSVTLPSGITTIPESTFYMCFRLSSVSIPSGVTSIGERAFAGCDILSSVTLPNTLRTIGRLAFDECASLRNITIPNSVTTLGDEVFEQTGLTSITIPSSITSIGQGTFYQCKSLSSVTFAEPSGISTLTLGTFAGCSQLTSLTLPSGITTIEEGGVQDCRNLASVVLPSTLTSVGKTAFYLDSSLTEVWCFATTPPSLGSYAFYSIGSDPTLYVPSESVNAYQSSGWANYFSSILPIDAPVTYACQSMDANGANYNPIFQEYLYRKGIASNLVYTTMTEALNLTEIGTRGLEGETNLTSLGNILSNFPNLNRIGDEAFEQSGLTSINVPNGVTSIGEGAFAMCDFLSSVTLPNTLQTIGHLAFDGCLALKNITIPNSVTTLGDEVFKLTGLTSIIIPNSVTSIGDGLFYHCTSLSSVVFDEPSGISTINTNTFAGCSALTSLTLPSGITTIGDGGVQDCRNLRTVTLPSTLTSVGKDAFYLDSSLTEVWCYATNPPGLGNYAFYSIGSDPTLYVPSSSVSAYKNSDWGTYFNNIASIQ